MEIWSCTDIVITKMKIQLHGISGALARLVLEAKNKSSGCKRMAIWSLQMKMVMYIGPLAVKEGVLDLIGLSCQKKDSCTFGTLWVS